MAFELVTFETIKDLMGLNQPLISDYPDLAIIKMSVETAIEEELGRSLEKKERTETLLIGSPTRYIDLSGLPVVTVSEVLVDGDAFTSYSISPGGIKLGAAIAEKTVEVTYIGGYDTTPPASITRAALMQTIYEYQGKDNIGASSVSNEGGSVSKPALTLLPMVKNILDGYKHPSRMS